MAAEDEYRLDIPQSIRILVEGESEKKNSSKPVNVTICKVPDSLRNLNPSAYTPRITSIGPLHKENQRLRTMDELKMTYMYRLFCRVMEVKKKDTDQIARTCLLAVRGLLPRARACYAQSFTSYDDIKLAEMMVIDGCFILELVYRLKHGIGEGDPIFDNILVMHDIQHDLMLLENQIPFFILETLFDITVKVIRSESTLLTGLIFYFFKDMNFIINSEFTTSGETVEHCHILGLLQSCYRPRSTTRCRIPTISYSATEIDRAGVTFKAHKDEKEKRFKTQRVELEVVTSTNIEDHSHHTTNDESKERSYKPSRNSPTNDESKERSYKPSRNSPNYTNPTENIGVTSPENKDENAVASTNITVNTENATNAESVEYFYFLGPLGSCCRPKSTISSSHGDTNKARKDKTILLDVIFKQSYLFPCFGNLIVRKTSFRIPPFFIKNSTSSFLRNLIAYEQCYPLSRHYVTSFAFLMDRLIDTKDDVSLLVRSKILHHNLGAYEDVTDLFNNICNGVVVEYFYYGDEWKQLNDYCNRFWPSKLIALRRIFVSTTWKTLTVIAAVILFGLTLVQTIYAVTNS